MTELYVFSSHVSNWLLFKKRCHELIGRKCLYFQQALSGCSKQCLLETDQPPVYILSFVPLLLFSIPPKKFTINKTKKKSPKKCNACFLNVPFHPSVNSHCNILCYSVVRVFLSLESYLILFPVR